MDSSEVKSKLQERIFNFFVESHDFNGIPLCELQEEFNKPIKFIIDLVKELVVDGNVSIQSSTNPHIIGFQHYPTDIQLKILEEAKTIEYTEERIGNIIFKSLNTEFPICLYPSQALLKEKRDVSKLLDAPYTLQLALAEPHLKPIFFEIEVLDRYFSDPRYDFDFRDYSGSISCRYDEDENPIVRDEDRVFVKTFGLGFDSHDNRLAVVYLRYLKGLTKEHQAFWKSKESKTPGKVLREYHENSIMGNWTFSHSIFSALLGELTTLNKLATAVFGRKLFREDFEDGKRPREFTFFFTPTLKNYNEFVLLLDKVLSENINKDFFKGEIELYEYQNVSEGIVERKQKGTLTLLEEWLTARFHAQNMDLMKELFKPLKKIRRERQNPAHRINENKYNKTYIEQQKKIMKEAYNSIRAFREIFGQHPKAKDVEIPRWLEKGRIILF